MAGDPLKKGRYTNFGNKIGRYYQLGCRKAYYLYEGAVPLE